MDHLGDLVVIAPVHRAGDPGMNLGPGENFFLKLLITWWSPVLVGFPDRNYCYKTSYPNSSTVCFYEFYWFIMWRLGRENWDGNVSNGSYISSKNVNKGIILNFYLISFDIILKCLSKSICGFVKFSSCLNSYIILLRDLAFHCLNNFVFVIIFSWFCIRYKWILMRDEVMEFCFFQ